MAQSAVHVADRLDDLNDVRLFRHLVACLAHHALFALSTALRGAALRQQSKKDLLEVRHEAGYDLLRATLLGIVVVRLLLDLGFEEVCHHQVFKAVIVPERNDQCEDRDEDP